MKTNEHIHPEQYTTTIPSIVCPSKEPRSLPNFSKHTHEGTKRGAETKLELLKRPMHGKFIRSHHNQETPPLPPQAPGLTVKELNL